MKVTIVDYGVGNLRSVQKAFEFVGYDAEITSERNAARNAEKLVLPGVGAFKDAIRTLNETGMADAVKEFANSGRPLLGICLGMQLMFDKSYENGEHEGLSLLKGDIVKFKDDIGEKIPHMGWNDLNIKKELPLFTNKDIKPYVYFVHSYHAVADDDIVSATCFYGYEIAVSAQRDNIYALQFHPEKSGAYGLSIIKNFGGL